VESSKVYLAQTDTTVGFLSSNDKKLSDIKQRDPKQKILQTVDSLKSLNSYVRVPKRFRKMVRNSKKTTFIYQNGDSYRVVGNEQTHNRFLKKFGILYSTSANLTQNSFCIDFAVENADILVYNSENFFENNGSKIYKINKTNIKRIR
jgi:tRNA A37 threonylcarbamoyladenosine synthetase subunit TsaC/SUA5/YrdC